MRFVRYQYQLEEQIGVLQDGKVIDLAALHDSFCNRISNQKESFPDGMESLIELNEETVPYVKRLLHLYEENDETMNIIPASKTKILAPISKPEKIICVGLNYLDHCREMEIDIPKSPVIFSKYTNSIIGEYESIEIPKTSNQVDYEAELAVVIGKEAKNITEEEAFDYIFGYTIMNDISARDYQFSDGQWTRGKSADTFAPIGPSIVTKDEVRDPHNLDISLYLNDKMMQGSNTKNLIFKIPYIISYLSHSMTLKPGDLIATGTPPGVGMGRKPEVWLKDKDKLSITIENIGTLQNDVKKAIAVKDRINS